MKILIPVNKRVLIETIAEKSAFNMHEKKFAEKGTIIAIAEDCPKDILFKVGDVVGFQSFSAYRNEEDDFWTVPYDKITLIEKDG